MLLKNRARERCKELFAWSVHAVKIGAFDPEADEIRLATFRNALNVFLEDPSTTTPDFNALLSALWKS
jgi:hypothetical protein